jgi:hypothetical protein
MKTCALLALCAASVKASDGEWLAQYFPPLADWATDCDTNTDGSYTATELYNCAIGNVPAETVAEFEARFDEAFESADSDGDGALNASELSDFQSDFEESVSSDSDGSGSDRRRLSSDSDSDALGEIIRYFPAEADFFTDCPNADGALTETAVYDCLAANVSEWRIEMKSECTDSTTTSLRPSLLGIPKPSMEPGVPLKPRQSTTRLNAELS